MARRNRKTGPRTKSGRLSTAYRDPRVRDMGTPEVQAKRRALVGQDGDPALAATALDILFANGFLTTTQHTVGVKLRRLHWAIYPRAWRSNSPGGNWPEPCMAGTCTPSDCEDGGGECPRGLAESYRKLVERMTGPQRHVALAVCAHDEIPNWFYVQRLKLIELPEDRAERGLLVSGLNAVVPRSRAIAA